MYGRGGQSWKFKLKKTRRGRGGVGHWWKSGLETSLGSVWALKHPCLRPLLVNTRGHASSGSNMKCHLFATPPLPRGPQSSWAAQHSTGQKQTLVLTLGRAGFLPTPKWIKQCFWALVVQAACRLLVSTQKNGAGAGVAMLRLLSPDTLACRRLNLGARQSSN